MRRDGITVEVNISNLEILQNRLPEQIDDLIEARLKVAEAHLRYMIEEWSKKNLYVNAQ
jgi:hypothetical protein